MSSTANPASIQHFLEFIDLPKEDILYLLSRARFIKQRFKNYEPHMTLHDRTLAIVFEKAITRTRVSFVAGMYQMGISVNQLSINVSTIYCSDPTVIISLEL